jgi:RHS repeat-associated protein
MHNLMIRTSQTSSSWESRYTFSCKEKDVETGYSYFGARYYDSDLSIWLSVDPMSDERPSLSPYNYSSWNPVMRSDPNGELDDWVERNGEIVHDKDVTKGEDGKIQNLKEGDKYLGKEGWDLQYHYRSDGTKAEYATTLKETEIIGLRGSGSVVSAMEDAINKGYDPNWYPGLRRVVDAALTVIEIELSVIMFAAMLDDIALNARVIKAPKNNFKDGPGAASKGFSKGKSFKPGSKKLRDGDYLYSKPKEFQNWFH